MSGRIYDRPVGYLPAYELSRLHSGHGAQLRSAKFGPSALDGDVPVYLESSALALVQALIGAQRAINSMKVEAETAVQGDEQMMLDACEQISNEGLEASLAIQAALSTAAQPPADGALNTIAALRAQLAEAQRDAERLDWIIEHRAYVVSDPDCCDGYWLNYARPDGTMWTQATEHETPRAAIDAAKGEPS